MCPMTNQLVRPASLNWPPGPRWLGWDHFRAGNLLLDIFMDHLIFCIQEFITFSCLGFVISSCTSGIKLIALLGTCKVELYLSWPARNCYNESVTRASSCCQLANGTWTGILLCSLILPLFAVNLAFDCYVMPLRWHWNAPECSF